MVDVDFKFCVKIQIFLIKRMKQILSSACVYGMRVYDANECQTKEMRKIEFCFMQWLTWRFEFERSAPFLDPLEWLYIIS